MSTSGLTNQFIPSTLDGLVVINADEINIGGNPIDIDSLVPYTGANKTIDAGSQPIKTNYAPIADADVVNLLTLQNAIAYIDGINVANFVKYTGSIQSVDLANNNLTVNNLGQVSFSNLIKTELNNVLAGYNPASITAGNNFGTITNAAGVYQSTSTAVFASLVLGAPPAGEKYIVSLSLKSVDTNNTNLYLYGSTTPNMTGSTGQIVAFSIPPNTTGFTVFTNTITFPLGSTYLLLVYFSQKPSGIDTLYWNAFSMTGMGSVVKNLIAPSTGLDATNKTYVDTQDNAVANFAAATYVGYTNSFQDVDLTLVGNNSLKGYKLTATNKVIAPTAQFTAITSATPSLALGVDGSGNLNTFAVPSATNLLPLNNTWTGTNTFNNTLTTADGYTNNFGDAVYTGVNAITSGIPTTTGITAAAPSPLPTISYSIPTYTCTPSGALTFACFWASGTFTQNVRYFFSFTNATTTVYSATAQLTVCQANTANSAYIAISTAYNLPTTSTPIFSGYFTPNTNASYTGQVFFILSNVKFTPFTWTAFSYGVGALTVQGNESIIGLLNIHAGSPYAVPNGYMAAGSLTIGDITKNYGGGTTTFTNSTAGLMLECLDSTEIAVHDAGARVSSLMRYNANTLTLGRDMGWGVANTSIAGTLDTASNITMATGIFRKNSAGAPNSWITMNGGDGSNSPFVEFVYGSLRRGYIGNASASAIILAAENNCDFNLYTGGSLRMITKNNGLTGFGRDPSFTVDINGNQRVFNGLNGNDSMTVYGPNASWGAYLVVGAGTDRAGGATAQVITTNGNLHIDAGNSNAIYYGYYANARGTPNPHLFFGTDIQFQSGLPQNNSPYSHVACLNGNVLQRSQCMQKRLYQNGSVAWGGGINNTYAFYKYNQTAVVRISGKYSGFWTSGYMAYVYVRIYSQSTGGEWGLYLPTYTNNAYNHITIPFDIVYNGSELPATGWFDLYMANSSGYNTDGNDQMTINVQVLPVDAF